MMFKSVLLYTAAAVLIGPAPTEAAAGTFCQAGYAYDTDATVGDRAACFNECRKRANCIEADYYPQDSNCVFYIPGTYYTGFYKKDACETAETNGECVIHIQFDEPILEVKADSSEDCSEKCEDDVNCAVGLYYSSKKCDLYQMSSSSQSMLARNFACEGEEAETTPVPIEAVPVDGIYTVTCDEKGRCPTLEFKLQQNNTQVKGEDFTERVEKVYVCRKTNEGLEWCAKAALSLIGQSTFTRKVRNNKKKWSKEFVVVKMISETITVSNE